MIRVFQIVGACAVVRFQLAEDVHLPQADIIWRGVGRMGYIARWQAELVYLIFIILCGSLIVYALRTGSSRGTPSEHERDNI